MVIVEDVPQISLAIYVFNAPLPCFTNALEPIPGTVLANKLIAAGLAAFFTCLKAAAMLYWTLRQHRIAREEAEKKAAEVAKRCSGNTGRQLLVDPKENTFGFDEHTSKDVELDFLTNYVSALGSFSLLGSCVAILILAPPGDTMPGDSTNTVYVIVVAVYLTMVVALGSAKNVLKCCASCTGVDHIDDKKLEGIDGSGLV